MTRGPAPKENAVRRNVHEHAQELTANARRGRELPRALGVSTTGAKRFWRTWSQSPQSEHWLETDWAELEITTKLVDALYQGDLKQAPEIRQRVAKWGATLEDRNRLRMSVTHPDDADEDDGPEAPNDAALDEELFKLLSN